MAPIPFRLLAVTARERHAATWAVRQAVRDAGAWITGFRQFSNAAVVLELEVAPGRLAGLYAAVEATGLSLSPALAELPGPGPGQEELAGALRIEFVHDEPDLIVPVPAVPG